MAAPALSTPFLLAASDRQELEHWICTDPPQRTFDRKRRRRAHPRPWELEVQSYFRQRPKGGDLLGWRSGEALVGLAHTVAAAEAESYFIAALARAQCVKGLGVGDAILDSLLEELRDRPGSRAMSGVYAKVHPRNTSSLALFDRHGFVTVNDPSLYHVVMREL